MSTAPNKITVFKIDSNFFTGSVDTFRKVIGSTYSTQATTVTDATGVEIHKEEASPAVYVTPLNGVSALQLDTPTQDITHIQMNIDLQTFNNAGPIKSIKVPIRIIGDENTIRNNQEWKTRILGGTYGNNTYETLYTAGAYDIYGHTYDTYYPELQKNKIQSLAAAGTSTVLNTFDISYLYNAYLPEYQNAIASLNERQIPSIYFNQIEKLSTQDTDIRWTTSQRPYLEAFVSREGVFDFAERDPHTSKDYQLTESPPPYILTIGATSDDRDTAGDGKYRDRSLYLREYLTGAFVNANISSKTEEYINEKTKTIYFSSGALDTVFNTFQQESGESDAVIDRYPMCTRIKFPIHQPTDGSTTFGGKSYTQIIGDNKLQEEFLSYLKGTFVGHGLGGTTPTIEFVTQYDFLQANETNSTVEHVKITNENVDAATDFPQMLVSIMNNSDSGENSDEYFITSNIDEVIMAKNQEAAFRYSKTLNAKNALNETINKINLTFVDGYNLKTKGNPYDNFMFLHNKLQESIELRTPEIVAYRIEKVGGPPIGEARRREKIQDTFFFNDIENGLSKDGDSFIYYDTQVKYGEEYTYSVYAYMIVEGLKYRYSDLRIGNNIGTALRHDRTGSQIADWEEPHCIEFVDPVSGTPLDQLLNTETNLLGNIGISSVLPLIHVDPDTLIMTDTTAMWAFKDWLHTEADLPVWGGFAHGTLIDWYNDNYISIYGVNSGLSPELPGGTEWRAVYEDWALLHRKHVMQQTVWTGMGGPPKDTVVDLLDFSPNRFATNAQIKAANKYLADFHFEIEPSVKIVQVPLTSKGIKIIDHPPVACDVSPYQREDNSQIIGFYVNQESFSINSHYGKTFQDPESNYGLYPTPMTPEEHVKKSEYLLSNNMIEGQIIKKYSISPINRLEVYRINKKPTKLSDFANHLVYTKDLSYEENNKYNYTNCFYEEQVATNQKYYYLFKFLNANGSTGYFSPIQVAELIDDGGYKYAVFDTMFETDLEADDPKQISINFKKLLQIMPAARQLNITHNEVSPSENPHSLLDGDMITVGSAQSTIWDKKFKFRLTSKKTGKKIDLNIKYKIGTL